VDNLATTDWRINPHVVQELVTAAQKDTAPSVRVCCIRCLAKMNVQGSQLLGVFQTLKQDSDPRVRHEAEQALVGLRQARSSSPALSFAPVGN
jgi:hypothetical protein